MLNFVTCLSSNTFIHSDGLCSNNCFRLRKQLYKLRLKVLFQLQVFCKIGLQVDARREIGHYFRKCFDCIVLLNRYIIVAGVKLAYSQNPCAPIMGFPDSGPSPGVRAPSTLLTMIFTHTLDTCFVTEIIELKD
jgi:hypothetical protein